MRALIVDDEPLARTRLSRLLTELGAFSELYSAENADQALSLMTSFKPEVVFLDIAMPGLSGLQLAEKLGSEVLPPAFIFVTAHPEHALDAYSVAPVDYLLKPVNGARLVQAIARLRKPTLLDPERGQRDWPTVTGYYAGQRRQLPVNRILYFRAEDKYVRAVSVGESMLTEQSLQHLLSEHPALLIRIHRNTLINKLFFKSLVHKGSQYYVQLSGCNEQLEVSRRLVSAVKIALAN